MYHVTETRKQNATKAENRKHASEASYAPLRDGRVLLRYNGTSAVLETKASVSFLDHLRNLKTSLQVKTLIGESFPTATA